MLIIIEGPDLAGKTTLAELVASTITDSLHEPVEVRHCGPLKEHPLIEYEQVLDDYVPGAGKHIVYDRLHLGELIYGPVKRGESRLTREAYTHVELALARLGAVIATVDAPNTILLERHRDRGESFVTPVELLQVANMYRMLERFIPQRSHYVAVSHEAAVQVAAVSQINERLAATTFPYRFGTYIGVPNPRILLLGDRRGPSPTEHARAFVPYPNSSGAYLMRAVSMLAWNRALGIANACEEDIGALWTKLGNPRVVALGRNAQQRCREAELRHGTVPHPQYMRRFHHEQVDLYGAAIVEAAQQYKELIPWPH